MAKITHFAKIKPKMGVNYYIERYHITAERFTGIDEHTASYLRKLNGFEVITKNQYNKQFGKGEVEVDLDELHVGAVEVEEEEKDE